MCGIAGFLGDGRREHLAAMTRALSHRGPDDEGFHIDEEHRVFLGFRRLAVIDPAGGRQPMWNEDGSVCVIFNGEIYNQAELRAELERRGHRFRTDHSDTEVLVHGYEEWGAGLPVRLNGMFAFVVWDRTRQRLFAARDRFGEKPFYYSSQPGLFLFGSELSALARHPRFDRTLDQRSLQKFFAYGYLPAPNTMYQSARKLPGGCHVAVDLRAQTVVEARYWCFRIEAEDHAPADRDAALAAELCALIDRAVARRLVSDVPLGIFLSGGVDSSAILAFAARHRPAPSLDTFTVGFDEPSFDESGFARDVARAIGSRHHEKILSLDAARDAMDRVLTGLDEPLGDPSILPTYLLSSFARETVTVALSGDGGDELFAGYDPFAALEPARWYNRLVPTPVHLLLRRSAGLLPVSGKNMSFDYKLRRALTGLSYPSHLWNPVWMAPVEPALMASLFEAPLQAEELYSEAIELWDQSRSRSVVDRTLEFFTNLYLQDDILTKADRAAMSVSLESRAVFLDNDIVEFCRRLPHGYKLRNGQRKYLLKKAVAGAVAPAVLARRKKGFGIPLARWLRDVPAVPPLAPVPGIRMPWVADRWRSFRAGQTDDRLFLWSWASLQAVVNPSAPAALPAGRTEALRAAVPA
ncbi:MAG TPA: asparagine synthase (glutamine-hydrolyzing) [Stellaceae bacterium]|nr:asparagine synthase (glutamine-hydrolyzing) [Stellaceae bacterium]